MEELSLSHIFNAEGEKIQYVLGTLNGQAGPGATIDDILAVNKSVQNMLSTALQYQLFMTKKMDDALKATPLPD
jgi:hypothetical protein